MITILGVDPGTARVGWGIITERNSALATPAYGCITTDKTLTLPDRLSGIYSSFRKLIDAYQPDEIAVEDLFFSSNAKTAIAVGQARGVILLAAAQAHIPVISYNPMTVKKTMCGSGSADKAQVGKMVTLLLHLTAIPKPDDTADALAIAATHGFSYKLQHQTHSAILPLKRKTA